MSKSNLTLERLKELLHYDPETGIFTWRVSRRHRVQAGDVAGSQSGRYIGIRIDYVLYYAHRLAWFYVHGEWSKIDIDHKDLDKTNNRIDNLRDVTRTVNKQNRQQAQPNNKLGILGVRFHDGGFQARINVNGKDRHLGSFRTKEEASNAYLKAKRELHEGNTM